MATATTRTTTSGTNGRAPTNGKPPKATKRRTPNASKAPATPLAERYAVDRSFRKAMLALALAGQAALEVEDVGEQFCRADIWYDIVEARCFCEAVLPLVLTMALPKIDLETIAQTHNAGILNSAMVEFLEIALARAAFWFRRAGWKSEGFGDEVEWSPATRQIIGLGTAVESLQSLIACQTFPFDEAPYEKMIDAHLLTVTCSPSTSGTGVKA